MTDEPGLMMKYFVLKPHGTDAYAKASRSAMHRYARMIQAENPQLAEEVSEWAEREGIDVLAEQRGQRDDLD